MNDEFANRQRMHRAVVGILDDYASVWTGQGPEVFAELVADFKSKVTRLDNLLKKQAKSSVGTTEAKKREEEELEEVVANISPVLVAFLRKHEQEKDVSDFEFSPSSWRRMRDTDLVRRADLLKDALEETLGGPLGEQARRYGLDDADMQLLDVELQEFIDVMDNPDGAIAKRRVASLSMRPSFREVLEVLEEMDAVILRYKLVPNGSEFIETYQQARIVRDQGSRSEEDTEAPTE